MTVRDIIHKGNFCMPFPEIIRIREAEAGAMTAIAQARAEADARIQKAHADARETEADAQQRARTEVAAHIAAVEGEVSAQASTILTEADKEIAAIRETTDARLDQAIAFIVGEVTKDAQTR